MENVLQLIERQRERKANRSVVGSHNSSGSDVHDAGDTFTVGTLNATRDVDRSRHTSGVEPQNGALFAEAGLQPRADDAADHALNLDHIRHRADEPVVLRSDTDSLWRKDDAPKVIPRKIASYLGTCESDFTIKCQIQ